MRPWLAAPMTPSSDSLSVLSVSRRACSPITLGPPRRFLSSSNMDPDGITLEVLVEELEQAAAGESDLLVIDVRSPMEIQMSGPINPDAELCENVPLDLFFDALELDDDEWEDECGFPKPSKDRPLVFSCAAGVRSEHAMQAARAEGWTNTRNYRGGAMEFFSM